MAAASADDKRAEKDVKTINALRERLGAAQDKLDAVEKSVNKFDKRFNAVLAGACPTGVSSEIYDFLSALKKLLFEK
jgi:hypothetical protein